MHVAREALRLALEQRTVIQALYALVGGPLGRPSFIQPCFQSIPLTCSMPGWQVILACGVARQSLGIALRCVFLPLASLL